MARTIPISPRPTDSAQELRIFDMLRQKLSQDWLVIHRPHWLGRARPDAPLDDGEATFLVAHPEHGVFALLEVDGGLRYDPSADRWQQVDHAGRATVIADPFRQAEHAVSTLVARLRDHPAALPGAPAHGHGVLLPDVLVPPRGLASHAPADIALGLEQIPKLPENIEKLAKRWQRIHPPQGNASSRWWWRALEDLFLMPREARVLLRHRIAAEQAQLLQLSPQQLQVLDLLNRKRFQAIYGPAGTGKTILAMHKARLLARQGQRVLLTCHNRALGLYLRESLADEPNVTALHFHDLCYEITGIDAARHYVPDDQKDHWFDVELAQRVIAATERDGPRFDALIVDEAQDFLPLWWQALNSTLVDPQRAIRYLFYDDAQQLRPDAAPVEGADEALVLSTNWRNTQAIHSHLTAIEPRLAHVRCVAPPGVAVETETQRPHAKNALRRVLQRILGEGGVNPEDVVILSGRSLRNSYVMKSRAELAPIRLSDHAEPGCVRVVSINAFKGMEAPVVILTELDHMAPQKARQMHYIGASRAVHHLVVLDDAVVAPAPVGGQP
jgi:hypothetical protein